ncbi:MAG: macro domain-containing protein [Chloroflexota bacterium]
MDEPFSSFSPRYTEEDVRKLVDMLLVQTAHLRAQGTVQNTPLSARDQLCPRLISRQPFSLSDGILQQIDRLLTYEQSLKPVMDASILPLALVRREFSTRISLWQGDICALKVDAIVNAANNQMLGCFQPFHKCIDNVIHAAAGPRLRDDCARIMDEQKKQENIRSEETGCAKITRAYHLPARFILHTVGPIYETPSRHATYADLLSSCYTACLETAAEILRIRNLAFCCISTGVFGFPNEAAAQIAINSVTRWLEVHT